MLRITVELEPGGLAPLRRTIATMQISNLSDLADISDYCVHAMEGINRLTGTRARNAACEIRAHDRRQTVWALLQKACEEIQKADFVEL